MLPAGAFVARVLAPAILSYITLGVVHLSQAQGSGADPRAAPAKADHLSLGQRAANSGRHTEAIREYSRYIALHPKMPIAYLLRGHSHAAGKDLDRAIADYAKVIRLLPRKAMGYVARGNAYCSLGEGDCIGPKEGIPRPRSCTVVDGEAL